MLCLIPKIMRLGMPVIHGDGRKCSVWERAIPQILKCAASRLPPAHPANKAGAVMSQTLGLPRACPDSPGSGDCPPQSR